MNLQESIRRILREEITEDKNLYGEKLKACSKNPMTGFYRDGYCKTGDDDTGSHTVCARVTEEFLEFTKSMGNNLDMLEPGDKWCLCAKRWEEANNEGVAPEMIKSSTNIKTLDIIGSVEQELDEYARTLKNARKHGTKLRFPKSAIKANPPKRKIQESIRRILREETDPKTEGLLNLIKGVGLYDFIKDTRLSYSDIYHRMGELPREVKIQYLKDVINDLEQSPGELDLTFITGPIPLYENDDWKMVYVGYLTNDNNVLRVHTFIVTEEGYDDDYDTIDENNIDYETLDTLVTELSEKLQHKRDTRI